MSEFAVKSAEVSWLRVPFPAPISDATHTLEVMDLILVELEGQGGERGISYMLDFDYATEVLFHIAVDAARHTIGTDTRLRTQTWHRLWNGYEYIGQSGVAAWGIAIIDLALWDLYGHQVAQPLWALVGGAKPSTPAYGSGGWLTLSDAELLSEVRSYLDRGLGGYKMKVGRSVDEDLRRVSLVRNEVGMDVPLMVDANQGYDLRSARALSDRLADLNIRWFEEPMPTTKVGDYATLRATTSIPLAAGERAYYSTALLDLATAGGIDILQPDALRIGGVRGWLDLASIADVMHLELSPHFYREYDASLAATTHTSIFVENFFWTDPIFAWDATYHDGMVTPPESPGFGLQLKSDAKSRFLVRNLKVETGESLNATRDDEVIKRDDEVIKKDFAAQEFAG